MPTLAADTVMTKMTHMAREAREAPSCIDRQLSADKAQYTSLGESLRATDGQGIVTVARGSSDHAAQYFAYLMMKRCGRLVTSVPMSLFTLHRAPLARAGMTALAISQSGQSPDLIAPMETLEIGGATTVAMVNQVESPLAAASEWVLPLHAGTEQSVAATKSYLAALSASARLVASCAADDALMNALQALPEAMLDAQHQDWSAALEVLANADRIMVISRGTAYSAALEAALKFKETCGIQAEAFSSAEVRHGPMALIGSGYPLLVFAPRGAEQADLLRLARDMRERGARVLLAAPADVADRQLTLAESPSDDLQPLTVMQSFYLMVEQLARARGLDPDSPPFLNKVTRTR